MKNIALELKNLIAKGKVQEALERFSDIAPEKETIGNDAIMLLARFNDLRRREYSGVMPQEDVFRERNRITASFLHVFSDWEERNGVAIYLINQNKKTKAPFLDLGNCGLREIPEELGECTHLEELSLGEGRFVTESGETRWERTSNEGKKNNISSLPNSFSSLKNLEKLWIIGDADNNYALKDISPISRLNNLHTFYCDYTQIDDLSPLAQLSQLDRLSCAFSKVTSLDVLEGMESLKYLNLASTALADLKHIEGMKNLTKLCIAKTLVSDLGPLAKLKNLEYLDCQGTKITSIHSIKDLVKLTELNISQTKVIDLSPLQKLIHLRLLAFAEAPINKLGSLIQLSELEELNFSHTAVSDVKPLKDLNKLKNILGAYTEVATVEALSSLTALRSIDCAYTKLTEVRPFSTFPSLRTFSVEGCEIKDCPADVWESGDARQLRAYFSRKQTRRPATRSPEERKEEMDRRDVKLILLGNSASGKTSLIHYLETGKFLGKRNTTHGLDVHRWMPDPDRFPLLKDVTVSIWDFGGQEYYHGAYRLFLSANAVYLMIWDLDTDLNGRRLTLLKDKQGKVDLEHFEKRYWLDTIRHYGGNESSAPLLVVQNKTNEEGHPPNKRRISQQLHEQYKILDSFHISLKEGVENNHSKQSRLLRHFREELEQVLAQKADEATPPEEWEKIRQELLLLAKDGKKSRFAEEAAKNEVWISADKFNAICHEIAGRELNDDEIYTIPRWLEKGGVIAFFPENDNLADKIFFNPNVLASRIYEMLNKKVLENEGIFRRGVKMTAKEKKFAEVFIDVSEQLEIIFKHPDLREKDSFIAPQYLPESHLIEDLFKIASHGAWQSSFWIKVPVFYYKRLLHGLILHYIADFQTEARHFWKHGIVFLKNDTRVLLKGLYPKEGEFEGKLLIGVEKANEKTQKDIQQEIFFKCLDLLLTYRRFELAEQDSSTSSDSSDTGWLDKLKNTILHESNEQIHKQLELMEVSADGEIFIQYPYLLKAVQDGETKVFSKEGRQLLSLKTFGPILPKMPDSTKRVFLSYSHRNTHWLNRLRTHLSGLRRAKEIETWTDQEILPGAPWDKAIRDSMESADVFIILLSADFVASDYIWTVELPEILQKLKDNKAIVIPVLTEPHDFSGLSMLSSFEIIPKDKDEHLKAISLWANPEEALAKVAGLIRKRIANN